MSSGLYTIGVAALLKADIDLEADDIEAVLIDTTYYTVDLTEDSTLEDIPESARLSLATLSGKTVVGRVFNCDSITFSAVSGAKADALVLFYSSDEEENCTLLAYIDNATEFPITPDDTDITITIDPTGVFEL